MNHIVSRRLRHRIDGLGGREMPLDPERPGSVASAALHQVEPDGLVRFFMDFHRKTG
ncbi:hypothetical protein WME76_21920 [Sorangium sp. So ce119]|uniref:hypothetical protein n=1 Tax=Sorangium sp. So ce119 TaxID=3133279 RepID=UPI003F5F1879